MWWAELLNNLTALYDSGAAVANSYESIATITAGIGGTTTFSFTSIPSTYKHLQLRGIIRTTGASGVVNAYAQFDSDTGSNYAWHVLTGDGSTTIAAGVPNTTSVLIGQDSVNVNPVGVIVADILDYANTNKYKTVRALAGHDQNGSGAVFLASGLWQNSAAINSITISTNGTLFAQYSSFALYGVKG